MRSHRRPEHHGNDGIHHHEPYEPHHYEHHHRYDKYNDPCCRYDNGYDGCYCRHLHGHYGKQL
jgi:hypothetical protein